MGRIATFYSYKGGTGRSMALANFAWILACSGKKVLAVDWDLEAPGLHRYFRPFLSDPDLLETGGLIDTFWSLTGAAIAKAPADKSLLAPLPAGYYQRLVESERPARQDNAAVVEAFDDGRRRLDWKAFPRGAHIDFIGAGRQGSTYSERVNTFDWKRFYELGGANLLTTVKEHLCTRYDWVLLDSRTGVSDTSGICTIQMPSSIIACFTLNRQSIDGVTAILRSIQSFRSPSIDGSKIEFFPVAMRIENGEQRRLERARRYARPALAPFLPIDMQSSPREYWDRMEIAYRPAYAFEEVLAAFGDASDVAGAADSMLSQIEAMSRCIARDSTLGLPEMGEPDREAVLAKYALGTGPDPVEKPERRADRDVPETKFLNNLRAKEREWRQSGYNWRLLMSRRELDLLTDDDRIDFGRNMLYYLIQSERIYDFFRTIDLTFIAIIIVGILLSAGAAYAMLDSSYYDYPRRLFVPYLAFASVFVFPVVWIIGSAIANRSPKKPHGLSLRHILGLTLRGPFRSDIYDYEPSPQNRR